MPLSSPELVSVLRDFVLPEQPRDQAYKRWWWTWRRRHQAIARHYHRLRHEYQDHP